MHTVDLYRLPNIPIQIEIVDNESMMYTANNYLMVIIVHLLY